MFDVYLSSRRDQLLVIPRGQRIPSVVDRHGWQKKKAAIAVSAEIRMMVQQEGFYSRRLTKAVAKMGK